MNNLLNLFQIKQHSNQTGYTNVNALNSNIFTYIGDVYDPNNIVWKKIINAKYINAIYIDFTIKTYYTNFPNNISDEFIICIKNNSKYLYVNIDGNYIPPNVGIWIIKSNSIDDQYYYLYRTDNNGLLSKMPFDFSLEYNYYIYYNLITKMYTVIHTVPNGEAYNIKFNKGCVQCIMVLYKVNKFLLTLYNYIYISI